MSQAPVPEAPKLCSCAICTTIRSNLEKVAKPLERIAALEAQVSILQSEKEKVAIRATGRIVELTAHNRQLREALHEARDFVAVIEPEDGLITDMLLDQIAAALAATDKEKV